MSKKEKNRVGIVYSTNDEFKYTYDDGEQAITLEPQKQRLKIMLDTKHRAGKKVTIVSNFIGSEVDLSALCKTLKTKLGTGGSSKDGIIIIQGDVVQKTKDLLLQLNYKLR